MSGVSILTWNCFLYSAAVFSHPTEGRETKRRSARVGIHALRIYSKKQIGMFVLIYMAIKRQFVSFLTILVPYIYREHASYMIELASYLAS